MLSKHEIMQNRNIFLSKTNLSSADFETSASTVNRNLFMLTHDKKFGIRNIGKAYQNNILNLNEELQKKGIEYFGKEFSLRGIYEDTLIVMMNDSINVLKELTDKINKIAKISNNKAGVHLLRILMQYGLIRRYLEPTVDEYNSYVSMISDYKYEDHLEELLVKKYSDKRYDKFKPGYYILMYAMDKNMFRKLKLIDDVSKYEIEILKLVAEREKEVKELSISKEKQYAKSV